MKKVLALATLSISLLPGLALAAYNDVTLTASANISVGSFMLDVSGSDAAIQSIVVGPSSFSVTLAAGSSLTVFSPTLNQLSSDVTSDVTSNICTGSESSISLEYSGGGTVTNVITPSATICATTTTAPSSGVSAGGGGPIYGSGPLAPGYQVGATSTGPSNIAPTPSKQNRYKFLKNLKYGMIDGDVQQLQKYLNAVGFVVAKAGAGSPGRETKRFGKATLSALIKFQEAHAADILSLSGLTKGSGYFGPSTRTFVNSH